MSPDDRLRLRRILEAFEPKAMPFTLSEQQLIVGTAV
jgi:hypothetical protein